MTCSCGNELIMVSEMGQMTGGTSSCTHFEMEQVPMAWVSLLALNRDIYKWIYIFIYNFFSCRECNITSLKGRHIFSLFKVSELIWIRPYRCWELTPNKTRKKMPLPFLFSLRSPKKYMRRNLGVGQVIKTGVDTWKLKIQN